MNWEAVGAVGEILGAIAVLVTLIYLATQIKQHTLATRALTNSAYAEAGREFNMTICSPTLTEFTVVRSACSALLNRMPLIGPGQNPAYNSYFHEGVRTLFRRPRSCEPRQEHWRIDFRTAPC
jgi:hypothetical protein